MSEPVLSDDNDTNALLIAKLLTPLMESGEYRRYFPLWEEYGFHITPRHFYEPIPDLRSLKEETWTRDSDLPGIDLNPARQLDFLRRVFPRFAAEYNLFPATPTGIPYEFYFNNDLFSGTDALVLYCMVRHFHPQRIVEVGSGFSTLVSAQALRRNNPPGQLICIEPYPNEILRHGFPGLSELRVQMVQDMDLDFFSQLQENDILFIDTSHVVKTGGDVNYLYLEVLPRLRDGVLIHIHDIFFPKDYPKNWVVNELRFWTEQYLFAAFLTYNDRFEAIFANHYMGTKYLSEMQTAFPRSPWWAGGSFWMRKKPTRSQRVKEMLTLPLANVLRALRRR